MPGSTSSTAAAAWAAPPRDVRCAAAAPSDSRPAAGPSGRRPVLRAWRPASQRGSTPTCCARWCSPTRSTASSPSPIRSAGRSPPRRRPSLPAEPDPARAGAVTTSRRARPRARPDAPDRPCREPDPAPRGPTRQRRAPARGARRRCATRPGSTPASAPRTWPARWRCVAGARRSLVSAGVAVSVVVCDDVLTTGATAREAQRALEDGGLRVRAIVTVAATRKRLPAGSAPPARALPVSAMAD